MKKLSVFLALCGLSLSATAQIFRCIDATGKVGFSDAPCTASQRGTQIGRAPTLEEIALERSQAADSRARFLKDQYEAERPERERQAAIAAAQQKQKDEKQEKAERRKNRTVCISSGNMIGGYYSGSTVCR